MTDQTKLVLDLRKAGLIITSKFKLNAHPLSEQQEIHFGSVVYVNSQQYDMNILNDHRLYINLSTNQLLTISQIQQADKKDNILFFDKIKNSEQQIQFSKVFVNQIKDFCESNIPGQISVIQLVKNDVISDDFHHVLKQNLFNTFKIIPADLYPQKLLALDMGTGYYMLTLSEIVYQYNQFRQCYYVSEPGNINKSNKLLTKVISDIYFAPEFKFHNVPYYIATGQTNLILGNTAMGSFSEISGEWLLLKHYKKHLYEDNENIYFDKYKMNSNVIIPFHVSETEVRYIDVVHIFLVFLLHIKYALDIAQIKFDTIKCSIPIKAVQSQEAIIRRCIQFVFPNINILITSEPEAAFGEIILQKQLNLQDTFDHLMILDGGDGTFDYLYIQKFVNKYNNQVIWQQKAKDVSIQAGSLLYQKVHDYIMQHYIIDADKSKLSEIEQFSNDIFLQMVKNAREQTIKIVIKKQWIKLLASILSSKDNNVLLKFIVTETTQSRFESIIQNLQNAQDEQQLQQKFRLLCQWPCVLNNDVIDYVYTQPIQQYVQNYEKFYKNVRENMILENKWPETQLGVLFIGGMAQNTKIFEEFQKKAQELDCVLIDKIENPQVIVIKGVPIDRINITTRNLDMIAQENLYLCYVKNIPELDATKSLYVRSLEQDVQMKYTCSKLSLYATMKLLSVNDVLAPGYPVKKLTKQNIYLNEIVRLVLYKTKNEAPLFLSLSYNDQTSTIRFNQDKIIFNDSNLWYTEVFITEQDVMNLINALKENQKDNLVNIVRNQMILGQIPVSIYVIMDNVKFKTQPTIQMFYDFDDNALEIQQYFFKQINFFEWYQTQHLEDTYFWEIQQEAISTW